MAVKRGKKVNKAQFRVGCNVTLSGSKKMSEEEQDELVTVERVRLIIVAADADVIVAPGANMLVDEMLDAIAFSTGSVGYKLHMADVEFKSGG